MIPQTVPSGFSLASLQDKLSSFGTPLPHNFHRLYCYGITCIPDSKALAVADPRIQKRIDQVSNQNREHNYRGQKQVYALDHRVISRIEGNYKELTYPRKGKYVLYDNGAGYYERHLHAYQGNYRE